MSLRPVAGLGFEFEFEPAPCSDGAKPCPRAPRAPLVGRVHFAS
mgnify:CR=1 FL=1